MRKTRKREEYRKVAYVKHKPCELFNSAEIIECWRLKTFTLFQKKIVVLSKFTTQKKHSAMRVLNIKIYKTMLSIVLYGCETHLTSREEYRLDVFKNTILTRIF